MLGASCAAPDVGAARKGGGRQSAASESSRMAFLLSPVSSEAEPHAERVAALEVQDLPSVAVAGLVILARALQRVAQHVHDVERDGDVRYRRDRRREIDLPTALFDDRVDDRIKRLNAVVRYEVR